MVVQSKLIFPQTSQAIFTRPRLTEKLLKGRRYPITLIQAGTGFGKTTALIELCNSYRHIYWYHITEPDRDPTLFLAHLVSAFLPGASAILERLEQGGILATNAVLNLLINHLTTDLEEDAVLVLDDYHLVRDVGDINKWIEILVEQRPPFLHIALASRQMPETSAFIRWRVKGNILIVDQDDLAFTKDEILALFSEYHHFPISPEQAGALFDYTDGWIIALEMVWQRLQNSRSRRLDHILAALPTALADVFNFLAQEVLTRQPEGIQTFLLATSILRQMDAPTCDNILGIGDSQQILQQLHDRGLFIFSANQVNYRYQRLFQDFLLTRAGLDAERLRQLHIRAAQWYINTDEFEEAIYHLLGAGDKSEVARLIDRIGRKLLDIGRLGTLVKWIEQLDPRDMDLYPGLYLLQGDALRFSSKFEEAIACYNAAEKIYIQQKDQTGRSLALRSKAQVFLDTVRPIRAASLLVEALALLEPQEHPSEVADLLDLLAENKLNLGKPDEARALHREASMLRVEAVPDDIYLESRALLRTGKLHEASHLIEVSGVLDETSSKQRPQRFHREMPLLLSLIYLMLGEVRKGELNALKGIEISHNLDAPFVQAVGLMRLGHACQLYPHTPWRKNRTQKAREYYEKAINLVKPFNVMRVQVEPLWGLCRFFGYQGMIAEASRVAAQAIEIADASGDYWFVALLRTSLGTSYALAGEKQLAEEWLNQARAGFQQVGDSFGLAAVDCALMLNHWLNGDRRQAILTLQAVIPDLRWQDLGFLLTRPSHLGVQDPQVYFPLLLEAQKQGIEAEWIGKTLKQFSLEGVDYHPGYGLCVRTLGTFEVYRAEELITGRDWQRDKARQLFQLFIAGKGKWFSRDQIMDRIWPELDPESAGQNFKVALNALNHALEPARDPGKKPFFIIRRDNLYGLNPAAQVAVDVEDFLELAASGREEDLLEALQVYQGEYLGDYYFDRQVDDVREKVREQYFDTAMRLGNLYFNQERWDAAVKICHDILSQDACNEPAYQLLMRSHAARGNRSAVQNVYHRCCAILKEELDVAPSPETTRIWKTLTK